MPYQANHIIYNVLQPRCGEANMEQCSRPLMKSPAANKDGPNTSDDVCTHSNQVMMSKLSPTFGRSIFQSLPPSLIGLLGTALITSACSSGLPRANPKPGRDVACLHSQVYDLGIKFYQAVTICGSPKPDLTGDSELQQDALAWKIPFTIRPKDDQILKQNEKIVETGSHIEGTHTLSSAEDY